MPDDDNQPCAYCGAPYPIEELRDHGEDLDLCATCSDALMAEMAVCPHEWEEPTYDDFGDEGRSCRRCGVFMTPDFAMSWVPLVCDGYVPEPEA